MKQQINNRLPISAINRLDEMVNELGLSRASLLTMMIESGHHALKGQGLVLSAEYQEEFLSRIKEQANDTPE